ncbi:MAG: YdbL family protein [Puniceicoccaceae bacterium]
MKLKLVSLCLFLLTAVSVSAQSAAELKDRMAARLPAIDQMKSEQLVGENNQAYLTALAPLNEAQAKIVQDENADRTQVYTMLARQTGASLERVQSRRAEQLRELARPGTRYQTVEGQWVTKE